MRRTVRLLLSLLAVLVLLALPAAGALTQEATPAGGEPPSGNRSNPELGDPVTYITESGSEVARLELTDVVLPWNEFSEYYTPDQGSQYIAFLIDVENRGSRGSLIVRADDFRLQDVDGFFFTRSWAEAEDDAEVNPADYEIQIAPGETGTVVIVFQVLVGVEMSHLFWQPEYERLVTIANLDDLET